MLTAVIAFSAFCLAQGAQSKNLHEQYEKLLKSEQKVSVPTPNRTATLSGGNEYYVTTVFTTPNCASSSAYTATGYTLGACISAGGESSYMYTDCSESGSTTFITMTSCTSTDCSSGCSSFKIPQEGSCKTMSTMKCMSGDSPWSEYDFNYHMEIYWAENDCSGTMGTWTAVSVAEEDCNSWECKQYESDDGDGYAYKGSCDE